jgi:3-isopropylmalate/(R)-2-methylmalate dehydratase large subunit
VSRYAGTHVDVAYIGACTGAKLDDLRAAAQVLRGHKVAKGIRLIVAPASIQDQEQAREEGVLQVLMDAGAELFPTACGACSGYGDPMGDDITVISTTARNFKGRMGSPTRRCTWARPTRWPPLRCAGSVTDPREVLA